jgi:hypothetical protein
MATYESIAHILTQVTTAGKQSIGNGNVSDDDLDALRSFLSDVENLITRLREQVPAVDNAALFKDLMELHRRCTGPLQPFRGWIEDALSVVETLTPP